MHRFQKHHIQGLAWAATAVLIWSGSVVALRLGMVTNLNAYDLTALRFGTAAPLLLLVIFRNAAVIWQLGIVRLLLIIISFGAPYVILLSLALKTAPAATAGALNPGAMAVFAVLLGAAFLKAHIGSTRFAGIALIIVGLFITAAVQSGGLTAGHLILILTGGMWAAYAFIIRASGIPALLATAIVAVGSAVLYLPIYISVLPHKIADASVWDIGLQMGVQGVLVSLAAVYAFSRSIELLGLTIGAALPALIPLVSLGLGFVFLGEPAGVGELLTASVIGLGVALILTATSPASKAGR